MNVPLQNNTPDTEPQIACPIKFSRSQMRYSFVGQNLAKGSGEVKGTISYTVCIEIII